MAIELTKTLKATLQLIGGKSGDHKFLHHFNRLVYYGDLAANFPGENPHELKGNCKTLS